jgi:hypothetical protein
VYETDSLAPQDNIEEENNIEAENEMPTGLMARRG